MLRNLISFVFLATFATGLAAQSDVPDRRIVVTPNVDFYGSDLQNIFDTTFSSCRSTCLNNPACQAFTFNSKSNACFPKSNVSESVDYDGATSARVLATDPRVLAQAPARRADLGFLSGNDMDRARDLAIQIGSRHPAAQWSAEQMLQAVQDRFAQGDTLNAMRWTGAVVSVTDTSDQWTEYARLSLALEPANSTEKYQNITRALNASVNGYLRALNDPARVSALMIMGDALERDGRGRDTVRALRLAEQIQPRQDVIAALEAAIGKYGFRITEHRADNESAAPRICAEFSEPLIEAGTDYTPYVQLPDAGLVVQPDGNQICIDGVQHGQRYSVTFREGLPSSSGETLIRDVPLTLYVRDRSPKVAFPGRAYVLPRAADAALPIETVNLDNVNLTLRRVSDRNLLRAIQDDYFGRPLDEYQIDTFSTEIAEDVWSGIGDVQNSLNQTMTTRLPLGEVLADQPPGIYTLSAQIDGVPVYDDPGATQWFVLTDLGLTTLKGTDGLHVFARGLSDAATLSGIEITLLSRSNRELGTATTDANGHAVFAAGLSRGSGGASPALVLAQNGDADVAFLSLRDPAFDLSDRGVEGRPPAPPVDTFVTTDRGAYRAGEVINATVLARDGIARAITGLPMTAILTRPDGVEYARYFSGDDRAGGHVFQMPIGATAPRGTWRLDIKADADAPALASTTVLVEDFLPERIDFDLALPKGDIRPGDTPGLMIEARYLFGAPGAGLSAEGDVLLQPRRSLDAFPGYVFGRYDDYSGRRATYFDGGPTDQAGRLTLGIDIPETTVNDRPHEATVTLRIREGSGRPVERKLTRMLAPSGPMIGLKPAFDGVVPEGAEASFQVMAIGADLIPQPMQLRWTINRVSTRYQWYQQWGNWNWEPITTRTRVTTGEATVDGAPLTVSAPVEWGQYELIVERTDGTYVASSQDFYAGWYAPADASQTPDTLELSLDKPGYSTGDTAQLRIVPRYSGTALVTVMSNRVISRQAVTVEIGENLIPVPVTADWGAGAYVTAQVIRPMNIADGQNPARSLGLAYATIDPGDKQLSVNIDTAATSDPRGPLTATVQVDGIAEGETAFVTLAAVDVGILNLTAFDSPNPSDHYFGQRRLGVEIRDIYGRLIDGMNGAQGQVRSGGDAGAGAGLQSPPPTEELVAFFTGPVTIDAQGRADVSFDIPDFNGTVRLMAVAWSDRAVGQAEKDVLVRDPVVITASLPRFLAPGDQSQLLLEIIHTEGPAGRMAFDISSQGILLPNPPPAQIDIGAGQKVSLSLPISAERVGDQFITVSLTTPDGKRLSKMLTVPVRSNDPAVSSTRRFSLAAGDTFTLNQDVFAGLRAGTGQAIISAGPLASMNAPALLQSLDRYPYGCTEQVTSRAMPLLYFNQVAGALGLGDADEIDKRIEQSIARILTRQSSNGAFGLWRASSGDFWLDAYVADFLSRARTEGYLVPTQPFAMAMDNLRNRVNYAPDFDDGGEDIAYALMVLAREGAASMGDLRYYADVKSDAFATPLALGQLGAALASYGDQTRADRMFRLAVKKLAAPKGDETQLWRADYGTRYRDKAGLLALMVEAGSTVADYGAMTRSLSAAGPQMSTQEQSWTLLAARALIDDPSAAGLTLNGKPVSGAFAMMQEADTLTPQAIRNTGQSDTNVTLTTVGVPEIPEPAGGYGYQISRQYFDTDGNAVDLNGVKSGTRLVTVLTISPSTSGEARLMVNDPLPAGLEIDNPNLISSGDISALSWLNTTYAEYSEFRSDRFLAAVDWRSDQPFQLAYVVRAVSPGNYRHPAATVEDMYRPRYRAHTDTGTMSVSP